MTGDCCLLFSECGRPTSITQVSMILISFLRRTRTALAVVSWHNVHGEHNHAGHYRRIGSIRAQKLRIHNTNASESLARAHTRSKETTAKAVQVLRKKNLSLDKIQIFTKAFFLKVESSHCNAHTNNSGDRSAYYIVIACYTSKPLK